MLLLRIFIIIYISRLSLSGAQWLSGRVLDSRPKGRWFETHRRHCVASLSKNINPSLVLVQPRKTRLFIIERLLMGRKESNQTNKQTNKQTFVFITLSCLFLAACIEVTYWERADRLALLYVMFPCFLSLSNMASWTGCGTWLHRFLIFVILLSFTR